MYRTRFQRIKCLAEVFAGGLIAFGILLRLVGYFAHRSLWGDEVAIALNLRFRSFGDLWHILDYEQTMPIPLLMMNKFIISVFGSSEYALRFVALLAGCCVLMALWVVFRRFFGTTIGLVVTAMAVICRPLIYYSSELKQYGTDVLVTVITVWFFFKVLEHQENWPKLIAWGALALFISQPTVFLLAGVGLAALVDDHFRASVRWRNYVITATAVWFGVFAALYSLSYRTVSHSSYMRAFWASSFLYPTSSSFIRQLQDAIYTMLGAQSFDHVRAFVLAALFVVGLYAIRRKHGWNGFAFVVCPFLGIIAAATLKLYPVATRLVLFIFPITFLVYASGLVMFGDFFRPQVGPAVTTALATALLVPTIAGTVRYAIHFPQRETTRDLVARMKAIDAAAPVYIAFDEYLQWAYYGADWHNIQDLQHKTLVAFHAGRRLAFSNEPGHNFPKELVGRMPPETSANPVGDQEWVNDEAAAILNTGDSAVWVFVPVYNNDWVLGHTFRQRRLLERLQEELTRDGARLVRNCSKGESVVSLYELPPGHLPVAQAPLRF